MKFATDFLEMSAVIARLDLEGDGWTPELFRAAVQERRANNVEQLADLAGYIRQHGPTASLLSLRVSLELEVAECDRVLS